MYTETSLFEGFAQIKKYTIAETISDFENNLVYDDPFLKDESFTTYSVVQSDFTISPLEDEVDSDHLGFVNYRYVQASYLNKESYTRPTLSTLLISVGGFLSLLTKMSMYLLTSYQNFTIDKSLIKKVFTWKEKQEKQNTSFFSKHAEEQYNFDMKQKQIKDTIQ